MEWKIITKEIKDDKGQIVVIETPEQVDKVGNIYQKQGGVIPKACQKCKKKFNAKIKSFPVTQDVPFYKCEDCKFENAGAGVALDHKLEYINHNIKKITKQRIVDYNNQLVGRTSIITITDDDCIIICSDCHGK